MPHITIEVSPSLLAAIDWAPVLRTLHTALAEQGWAKLLDLKSRVVPIAFELCGADAQAQQLVATLTLTNPRPTEVCNAMARTVFDHLAQAIDEAQVSPAAWTQCCVFLREHPKAQYLKRQWHAPPAG